MDTGHRIKQRRKELGISAEKLAASLGLSPATVYRYENGDIKKVPVSVLNGLADVLKTTASYLMGRSDNVSVSDIGGIIPLSTFKKIPVFGAIACGEPILAQENLSGEIGISDDIHADFALRCRGDSMAPTFLDGDTVLIRQQPSVLNGQIAAVLIDNEATLKHVYISENQVLLSPANPAYSPIVLSGEAMNNASILGLAVGYTRMIVHTNK